MKGSRHLDGATGDHSPELARRLAETWRTMEPSDREVATAHLRFRAGRQKRAWPSRVTPGAVALAIALCVAVASAAVRVGVVRLAAREPVILAASPGSPSGPRPAPPRQSDWMPIETAEMPAAAVASSAPVPDRTNRVPPRPSHVPSEPPSEATTREASWLAAAAAMRAGDYARAEIAFGELARSPDGHTRDAARLGRAQLWITEGRREDAQRELESLAQSGATAHLREEASATLDALRAKGSSPGPASGTNPE